MTVNLVINFAIYVLFNTRPWKTPLNILNIWAIGKYYF